MILTALFKNWGPALGLFGTIRGERMENSGTMLSNDDHKTSKAVLDQARETKAHWTRSWSSPKERILSRKSSSSKTTVKDDCGVDMAEGELVKGRRPPFQRLRIFIVRSLWGGAEHNPSDARLGLGVWSQVRNVSPPDARYTSHYTTSKVTPKWNQTWMEGNQACSHISWKG